MNIEQTMMKAEEGTVKLWRRKFEHRETDPGAGLRIVLVIEDTDSSPVYTKTKLWKREYVW